MPNTINAPKFTPEQIEQNRKFVDAEVARVHGIAKQSNLRAVVLVYWSPIFARLESRVGYFEDHYECVLLAEALDKQYTKLNLPHACYYIN